MPVLPPTEESTCASSVVGICTKRMPRRTMLAAKPARSPITPPPSAITRSPRSRPISSRRSHSRASAGEALGRLAGRQDLGAGVAADGLQACFERRQVAARDVGIGDDGALGRAEARLDQLGRARPAGRARSARRRSGCRARRGSSRLGRLAASGSALMALRPAAAELPQLRRCSPGAGARPAPR